MKQSKKEILNGLKIVILAVILSTVTSIAGAWTNPPTGSPPGCSNPAIPGCNAPLNVSSAAQSKIGGLVLGTGSVSGMGLWVKNGNVGIGNSDDATSKLDVNGDIRVRGGSNSIPGSGKVLTAKDATGLATWEAVTALCHPSDIVTDVRCGWAAANSGTGNGVWRAVNCVRGDQTALATYLRYQGGKWQYQHWNGGTAGYSDCANSPLGIGSVLIMRISS